jgi:hypothetical protein
MKVRKEAVILAAIIIGLSLYLILSKQDRNLYEVPELAPVSVAEISKLRLASAEDTIVLNRKAGKWVVNDAAYPGDENKIKRVSQLVADLKLATLISESKAYERYELDDAQKIAVQAWQADKLVREFDVGKTASSHRHTFVKLADDPRVYHANENLRSQLEGDTDAFRDKSVMSFESSQIKRVHIQSGDEQQAFNKVNNEPVAEDNSAENKQSNQGKEKDQWKDSKDKLVDETKINRLIKDISALKCQAYIYDKTQTDFSNPITTLNLEGTETYTLRIFEKTEEGTDYPAISSQSDYPFLLSGWRGDQLVKFLTEIKPADKETETSESDDGTEVK